MSKLTAEQVRMIRRWANGTHKKPASWLAARYQVSRWCIINLLKGRTWKHV